MFHLLNIARVVTAKRMIGEGGVIWFHMRDYKILQILVGKPVREETVWEM